MVMRKMNPSAVMHRLKLCEDLFDKSEYTSTDLSAHEMLVRNLHSMFGFVYLYNQEFLV